MRNSTLCWGVGVVVCALVIGGCDLNPFQPSEPGPSQNYRWCAGFLDIYFIFRTRMPSDLYAFSNAGELYASVDEPWTVYYPRDAAAYFMSQLTTRSGGIGILLDSTRSGYVINDVFPQSPGEQAGLRRRDTIITIDSVSCVGMSREKTLQLIKGPTGAEKVLDVKREADTVRIAVTLGEYLAPSVHVDTLDSAVAYILVRTFSDCTLVAGGTAAEFHSALEQTQWAGGTIVDLRGNPGGGVAQCLKVAGEFVPAGTPVIKVSERTLDSARHGSRTQYFGTTVDSTWATSETGIALQRNFAVLVDRGTASAAEIVVAALHEYRSDITTVGDTTFGKGRAQVVAYPSPDSGLAKVTAALLKSAGGEEYDLVGIPPDRVAADNEDPLEVAWNLLTPDTVVAKQRRRRGISRYLAQVHEMLGDPNRPPMAIIDIRPQGR